MMRKPGTTWIRASACALAVWAAGAQAGAHDPQFQYAVQHYKAGRHSQAYGRFVELANRGDSDAAHIALFMHKYGPALYGSWWDAAPDEVAHWSTLIRDHHGRPQPVFVADPYAVAAKGRQPVRTAMPTGTRRTPPQP